MIEDTLFGKLLRDTEPPKKTMQKSILDVKLAGKSRHNNAGKKKKRKGGAEGGSEDAGVNSATQDVMRKALKGKLSSTLSPSLSLHPFSPSLFTLTTALYSILLHTGSHIPPQQRTKIDQTIVAHLITITSDKTLYPFYPLLSYSFVFFSLFILLFVLCCSFTFNIYVDSKYKVSIYKCLKAAVLRPVPACPPILVYALRLFCSGLSDECSKVFSHLPLPLLFTSFFCSFIFVFIF